MVTDRAAILKKNYLWLLPFYVVWLLISTILSNLLQDFFSKCDHIREQGRTTKKKHCNKSLISDLFTNCSLCLNAFPKKIP